MCQALRSNWSLMLNGSLIPIYAINVLLIHVLGKIKLKAPRRVSTLQTYYFCPFRCITCWFYKNRKYFIFISNKCSMTCIMSWIQNKSLFLEFRDSKMNSNFSLQETIWNFDVCHLANINWPSLQGDNNFFLFKMNLRK